MGAIIKTMAVSEQGSGVSYRDLGSKAVARCLDEGLSGNETLDLLISTGIYPDKHIHEPAFASLIQGNLSGTHAVQLKATFSYDLHNGGGGALMAMRVVDGCIRSGKIQNGVIVAGDSLLMGRQAGALLLEKGRSEEGFQVFSQDTYLAYSGEYESYSDYTGKELKTYINQGDKFVNHVQLCVQESVRKFLFEQVLTLDDVDLIITSQNPSGFVSGLADLYGRKKLMDVNQDPSCYSAGLILALAESIAGGEFGRSKTILFVSAGPGIVVDLALYSSGEQ